VIVWVPSEPGLGVYVTEQLAEDPVPASVHMVVEKEPALLVVKLTVPVGVVGTLLVSVTVAVQVVGAFTGVGFGEQFTVVEVGCIGGGGGGATIAGLVTWKTAEFPAKAGSR
jgi:hypothetical protein